VLILATLAKAAVNVDECRKYLAETETAAAGKMEEEMIFLKELVEKGVERRFRNFLDLNDFKEDEEGDDDENENELFGVFSPVKAETAPVSVPAPTPVQVGAVVVEDYNSMEVDNGSVAVVAVEAVVVQPSLTSTPTLTPTKSAKRKYQRVPTPASCVTSASSSELAAGWERELTGRVSKGNEFQQFQNCQLCIDDDGETNFKKSIVLKTNRAREREEAFLSKSTMDKIGKEMGEFYTMCMTPVFNHVFGGRLDTNMPPSSGIDPMNMNNDVRDYKCEEVCSFCGVSDVTLGAPMVRVPTRKEWEEKHAVASRGGISTCIAQIEDTGRLAAVTVRIGGQLAFVDEENVHR